MNYLKENWYFYVIIIFGVVAVMAGYGLWVKIEQINSDISCIKAAVDANCVAIQNHQTKQLHKVPFKPKSALKYQTKK